VRKKRTKAHQGGENEFLLIERAELLYKKDHFRPILQIALSWRSVPVWGEKDFLLSEEREEERASRSVEGGSLHGILQW